MPFCGDKSRGIKPGAYEARSREDLPLREIPPIDPRDLKHEYVLSIQSQLKQNGN